MKRISTAIIIIILFLVAAAYAGLQWIKPELKNEVIAYADEEINAEVTFKDIQISLFRQFPNVVLSIQDLTVVGQDTFSTDTLLKCKYLYLEVDLKKYFSDNSVDIKSIEIHEPVVNVRVLSNGKANYMIAKTGDTTTKPDTSGMNLRVERLKISNGTISYHDFGAKTLAVLKKFNFNGDWDINKNIFDLNTLTQIGAFSLEYGGITYLNNKETDLDIALEVDTKKSSIRFKKTNIRVNHFNFGVTGQLAADTSGGYFMDLGFNTIQTDFKTIFSLLPGVYMDDIKAVKTNGSALFEGFVKGTYSPVKQTIPQFSLHLKVTDALFKYDSLPFPVEHIDVDLLTENKDGNADHSVLDIKEFKVLVEDNYLKGHLKIEGIKNPFIAGEINAYLDLAEIEKFYPIKLFKVKGILKADTKIDGFFHADKHLFPKTDSKITLEKGYIHSDSFPQPVEKIEMNLELKNTTGLWESTHILLNRLAFSIDGEPMDLKGSVKDLVNFEFDFDLSGKIFLNKIKNVLPFSVTEIDGQVSFDVETSGKLLEIMHKDFKNTRINGSMEANKLAFTPADKSFRLLLANGKFNFDASEKSASGNKNPLAELKADGQIDIKGLIYNAKELPNSINIHQVSLSFTENSIRLAGFDGHLGKSHVLLQGDLDDYISLFTTDKKDLIKGDLTMKCDTLDLNEWMADTSNKKDTTPNITVMQVPGNVDFTMDSEIKHLFFEDMNITDLDGEIKIKNSIMTINETGFNTLDAKFFASGSYNTQDINHPFVDVTFKIQEIDINRAYKEMSLVRTLAPAAANSYGLLSVDYKLKAELTKDLTPKYETMLGGGKIVIHEAKINGMKLFEQLGKASKKEEMNNPHLKDFTMVTEIRGSKINIKPFSVKVSGFDTDIVGNSVLDGPMYYLIKVGIPPFQKIKIPFHVSGTYDNPKIALGKGAKESLDAIK